MGMERIIEIYEKYNKENLILPEFPTIYIAQIGEKANIFATKLIHELRQANIYAEKDITGKSINSQFKYANKIGAKYVITIGENELESNKAELKNMATGETKIIELTIDEIIKNI